VGGKCRKVDLQIARLKKNDFQNLGGVNHILNIEVIRQGLATFILSSDETFHLHFLSCTVSEVYCRCAKQHAGNTIEKVVTSPYLLSKCDPRLSVEANTAGPISLEPSALPLYSGDFTTCLLMKTICHAQNFLVNVRFVIAQLRHDPAPEYRMLKVCRPSKVGRRIWLPGEVGFP